MTTLILTNERVRALTKSILEARNTLENGQATYLQGLVETTQKELGAAPRQRTGKVVRLDEASIAEQLAALTKVHERCYAIVIEVCSENLPTGKEKALELNRRSNFARTAMSVARSWIRSGRDITALAAAKVTKYNLRVKLESTRQPSPARLTRRVEKGITELIEEATKLAALDKAAAIAQLEAALSKIVTTLSAIGGPSATRDPEKAMAEHIPLRTKTGVFYPAVSPS